MTTKSPQTSAYIELLRHYTIENAVLDVTHINQVLQSAEPINPIDKYDNVGSDKVYPMHAAFAAFERILQTPELLDWATIKQQAYEIKQQVNELKQEADELRTIQSGAALQQPPALPKSPTHIGIGARPKKPLWTQPQVVVAVIGAAAAIIVGYWQYGPSQPTRSVALAGKVIDDHSTAVRGAKVTLEQASQTPQYRYTDSEGNFRFDRLMPGQARLRVEADGHEQYSLDINPTADVFQEIHLRSGSRGSTEAVKPDPEIVQLVSEFDNRIFEVETVQKQLADPAKNREDRKVLSILVWRVWYGDPAYRATLPEFTNIRWIGMISRFKAAGITQEASVAERAIHDIEAGNTDNGYDPEFLRLRIERLHAYSTHVLHPAIGDH